MKPCSLFFAGKGSTAYVSALTQGETGAAAVLLDGQLISADGHARRPG